MNLQRLQLVTAVLGLCAASTLSAQTPKLDYRPGVMIPLGVGVNGGIGTWGARGGIIVGKVARPKGDLARAYGLVLLGESATNDYAAVGVGVALAGGPALGPLMPLSAAGARLTINRARYNPYRNNTRRSATGVSLGLTAPLLNYGITLYREEAQAGLDAGWRWRLSFGIGF